MLGDMDAALSAIAVHELVAGVRDARHRSEREQLVELCAVIELTSAMARTAADLYTDLKAKGRLISNEDLLIAATALETGYSLLTSNRSHFDGIPGLLPA